METRRTSRVSCREMREKQGEDEGLGGNIAGMTERRKDYRDVHGKGAGGGRGRGRTGTKVRKDKGGV